MVISLLINKIRHAHTTMFYKGEMVLLFTTFHARLCCATLTTQL